MGMCPLFSSSSNDYSVPNPANPDPMNFEIKLANQVNGNVVLLINYPNCTNFKGDKILIFTNTTIDDIEKRIKIDPHFFESPESPFARFKPTKHGWVTAMKFAENI